MTVAPKPPVPGEGLIAQCELLIKPLEVRVSELGEKGFQTLHVLGFVHPVTREALRFETAPPEDMRRLESLLTEL